MKGWPLTLALFWLQLLIFLVFCDCTNGRKKSRTVVILDSVQMASFQSSQARIKYMSDDGLPEVQMIEWGMNKIIVNTGRKNIELALQDNNTVTQYFLIKKGDSVLLTEIGNNWGIKIINRKVLPFDENYGSQHDTLKSEEDNDVEEFYRACALINSGFIHSENNDEPIKELQKIKDKVMEGFPSENRLIDSLVEHRLISPEVAEFRKIKNKFDSLRISHYIGSRPDCSARTFLEPFNAVSTSNIIFSWPHLTFYDDWFDIFITQFYRQPNDCKNARTYKTLESMIQKSNIADSLVMNTLLRKEKNLTLNTIELKLSF